MAQIVKNRNFIKYGVEIGIKSRIGKNLKIHHPSGIVIGEGAVIGDDFQVFQNVTIGQKNGEYPMIGEGVVIYPCSLVIGGIKIGDNVVITGGSTVLQNIDDNKFYVNIINSKVISKREHVK